MNWKKKRSFKEWLYVLAYYGACVLIVFIVEIVMILIVFLREGWLF